MPSAKPLLPDAVTYCHDALDAAQGADAVVLVTEWNQFRAISPARLAHTMAGRIVIDLRNVYDPASIRQAGLAYHGIGRAIT
jgi:UDPglucose 6-dehydrogenase